MPESINSKNKVRPVFITYPNIYSLLMLNYLIYKRKVKFCGIILSTCHIRMRNINFSFLESFYILNKRSGLCYALYMFFIIKFKYFLIFLWSFSAFLTGKRLKFRTFKAISKEQNIPIFKSKNINSQETVDFMKSTGANLIVSAYNNQILRPRVCRQFTYRGIGIHNSYLPDFGGLDSAFEALYWGISKTGATIHYVDKGIDTGNIIMQERISLTAKDTLFSLNLRQWLRGARMLPKVLDAISQGSVESKKQDLSLRKYPYVSFPRRKSMKEAMGKGKRLLRFKEIFIPSAYIYGLFHYKRK
ncbi:MAG: hypothetical protein JW867_01015 [Candidatus Omnitrophica bacterium]|nr:hypothetical protein [Candidatus Omnitrophota bacterium]